MDAAACKEKEVRNTVGVKEGRIVEEGVDFAQDSEDGAADKYIFVLDSDDDVGEDASASVDTAVRKAAGRKAAKREVVGRKVTVREASVQQLVVRVDAAVDIDAAVGGVDPAVQGLCSYRKLTHKMFTLKRLQVQIKVATTWDGQVQNAIFCNNFITWK